MKQIAVITGASSGMGREFALRFAQMSIQKELELDEIWLIARRRERLEALAQELPIPAKVIALDLSDTSAFELYRRKLESEQPHIRLLLNCSGYGKFGAAWEVPDQDSTGMVDLNCRAVVAMTELSLPHMQKGDRILQMASLSAFQPVPYLSTYAASKVFVLHYSYGLRAELRSRGISVMAICPGWVKTDFFNRAEGEDNDAIPYKKPMYTVAQVVKRAIKDMRRNRAVSICGVRIRAQVRLVKLLPKWWVIRIWMRQQKHSMKKPKM